MLSNFNVAFGFVRNYGRILFKQAGIYYDGTNVVVPTQLSYKCRNLLDMSMDKGES